MSQDNTVDAVEQDNEIIEGNQFRKSPPGIINKGKRILSIGALAVFLAATSAGCSAAEHNGSRSSDEYVQVCYDEKTGNRVEDDKCPKDTSQSHAGAGSGFMWGWIASSLLNNSMYHGSVPAVGSKVYSSDSGFKKSAPSSGTVYNAPKSGSSFDNVRKSTKPRHVGSNRLNDTGTKNQKQKDSHVNGNNSHKNNNYNGSRSRGGGSFGGSHGGGHVGG